MNLKTIRAYFIIRYSGLFDEHYYLLKYPDVRKADIDPLIHFVMHGWKEVRNPSELFDTNYYLKTNPDVKQSGVNPLYHYLQSGKSEGRHPFPSSENAMGAFSDSNPQIDTMNTRHKPWKKISNIFLSNFLHLLRIIYRKLPLSAASRYKLRTLITRRFPRLIKFTKHISFVDGKVEVLGGADQLLSMTFVGHNPFRYGEKYSSYYSMLLGTKRSSIHSVLVDPPWYINSGSSQEPGFIEKMSRPKTKQFQTRFTIFCLINKTPAYMLDSFLNSILSQSYDKWNLEIWIEDRTWDADVLAMQFASVGSKIAFHHAESSDNILSRIYHSIQDAESEYFIFVNPQDELRNDSLYNVAKVISSHNPDLVFSRKGKLPNEAGGFSDNVGVTNEIPFSQLMAIKKEILIQRIGEDEDYSKNNLIHFAQKFLLHSESLTFSTIDEENYLFRPIPGRKIISLFENNGKVDIVEEIIPLRVIIDARLLDRKVTGTERYIKENLKALAQIRKEFNLELRAIAFIKPKETIEGVEFVTEDHLTEILNSHVFHKTFPASSNETLSEMALAPSVAFTPHDLIAFNNPEYFPAEANYYNFRINLKIAARLSDQIISHSNYGKYEFASQLDIPDERIKVVYLGIKTDQFVSDAHTDERQLKKLNIPSDYYFFIGTDYPHKNLITLLKALKIVVETIPSAALVIVGAQYHISPQGSVKELLKSLGGRVIQLGHVPDDVIPTLYHHAKALVFPSLYEGFGLPILEAMAFDTPVIATNGTSIPEVTGDAALLFDGYAVDQLADLMIRVWTDDDLRHRLIESGRKNVSKFLWDMTARENVTAYRQAVAHAITLAPDQRVQAQRSIIKSNSPYRPTVLIVTHIRFYPPTAGNEQRLFRLVKYLKKIGYQVFMLVNPFMEQEPLENYRRRVIHQYVDYYEELGDSASEKYSGNFTSPKGSSILEKWQVTELTFCPDEMMAKARQLIQALSPKIILAEYIWTSRIFELAGENSLKVIDLVDLFSQKKTNVVKFGIKDDLAITQAEELEFINRGDVALAIQETEAGILRSLEPDCEVITAGIDYEIEFSALEASKKNSLLIVGSDNQINVFCVNEFLNDAWPIIRKNVPDCILRIVGKVTNSIKDKIPNVELILFVEDLHAMYREASVVINPVYAGTGLKIKSVEAIGHGKALISWPEGVSGIIVETSPSPYIVIDGWQSLAAEVTDLLTNEDKRLALENAAREFSKTVLTPSQVYRQVGDRFDSYSKREIKILCLYLRYGPNDYQGSLETLIDWYHEKQKASNSSLTIWIIDNKIGKEFDGIDLATGFRLISGDNTQREFSGFQKVVEQYREEISTYDIIHFVTSAFDRLYTGYRDYFSLNHLYPILHRPLCLGHIDTYDQPIQLMGNSSQSWIRTCFFFMSPQILYRIKHLNSIRDESLFFDENGQFLDNGNIDATYIDHIRQWLSGDQMQGVSWHGSIKNSGEFKEKTISILNEHMLSINIRSIGVKTIDFYWLMKNIDDVTSSFDYLIPESMEQVRTRQSDLFNTRSN